MPTATPSDALHAAAQLAFLSALRQGATLAHVEAEVRRTSVKGFTPDVAMLELAVAAMDPGGCRPDQAAPEGGADELAPA